MLKRWGLACTIAVLSAAPAWAETSCGYEPIAPALPSVAELGEKSATEAMQAKHMAFEDIKTWQSSLKDYRSCLDSDQADVKRQLQSTKSQPQPDAEKIKHLQDQLTGDGQAYDKSTDSEEKIVNDFHALSTAYCARSDTDKTTCPKS